MSARGLVEVDSREVAGLIVIGPLQSPAPDADVRWRHWPTAAHGATSCCPHSGWWL